MKMKVAFLTNTTEQRPSHDGDSNMGDCLIGHGLKYILEQANPHIKFDWVDISRFGILIDEEKAKMQECDIVIYGGMPQYNIFGDWNFYYDDGIYDDIAKTGLPFYKFAGGFGSTTEIPTLQEAVERAKNDPKTIELVNKACNLARITTVRDQYAHEILNALSVKNKLLPCPASFSLKYKAPEKQLRKEFNIVSVTAGVIRDEQFEILRNYFNYLDNYGPTYWVCQDFKKDNAYLQHKGIERRTIIQCNSVSEFKNVLRQADKVVTTRLHTALPSYTNGSKVILFQVDTRASAARELGITPYKLDSQWDAKTLNELFSAPLNFPLEDESKKFYHGIFA